MYIRLTMLAITGINSIVNNTKLVKLIVPNLELNFMESRTESACIHTIRFNGKGGRKKRKN